jgi:hypothetical protein
MMDALVERCRHPATCINTVAARAAKWIGRQAATKKPGIAAGLSQRE